MAIQLFFSNIFQAIPSETYVENISKIKCKIYRFYFYPSSTNIGKYCSTLVIVINMLYLTIHKVTLLQNKRLMQKVLFHCSISPNVKESILTFLLAFIIQ